MNTAGQLVALSETDLATVHGGSDYLEDLNDAWEAGEIDSPAQYLLALDLEMERRYEAGLYP